MTDLTDALMDEDDDMGMTALVVSVEDDVDEEAVEAITDLMAASGIISVQFASHDAVQEQFDKPERLN